MFTYFFRYRWFYSLFPFRHTEFPSVQNTTHDRLLHLQRNPILDSGHNTIRSIGNYHISLLTPFSITGGSCSPPV